MHATLLVCGAGAAWPALAQAPSDAAPLWLRPSRQLEEQLPEATRRETPIFLSGERITGRPDLETSVDGQAELRKGTTVLRADRLEYYQPEDRARARGQVRINRAGTVYEGPALDLKLEAFEGFFIEPSYRFLKNDAYGTAERIDFVDDKHATIRNATFTTCQRRPGPSWLPDWVLRAASIKLDTDQDTGVADGAVLSFKGMPLLPIPAISFPLSEKRKSGFLPPTLSVDSISGVELTTPYYWNIAPNRDATLTPTIMSKRGLQLGSSMRYLEPTYSGEARLDVMPSDQLRSRSRWGAALDHKSSFDTAYTAMGPVGMSLNLNRVSDDNYWRDFSNSSSSLTQRLLASDAKFDWGQGDFTTSARVLKWQTLQDVTAPIVPPYDRMPQLSARYARNNVLGLDLAVDADYTDFQANRALTGQPNARRTYMLTQVARPWGGAGWFITPRAQLHTTHYDFDVPLTNGANSVDRAVPTYSLDSGLIFERDTSYFGRNLRQTLEPRAFYVYTPYRNQSFLPNYDSGTKDFNFASIYSENAFGGNDRIADNNLLTLGVTSRLLDPRSGAEVMRLGIAQRLRFKDQNVTLPGGAPVLDRISDVMAGGAINWTREWSLDSTVQYNPKTQRSVRSTVGGRYSPSDYRVISAAYRLQRDQSEQIDIGWQWPINDLWGDRGQNLGEGRGQGEGRWYSVGRMNYSMPDRKMVDAIFGFEYDAGCWLGRVVLERTQLTGAVSNQRILFQLEFVGFSRVGSNPLRTLRENIPRYQYLRDQIGTPSRFSNYD